MNAKGFVRSAISMAYLSGGRIVSFKGDLANWHSQINGNTWEEEFYIKRHDVTVAG